jgi:hypothetical protein
MEDDRQQLSIAPAPVAMRASTASDSRTNARTETRNGSVAETMPSNGGRVALPEAAQAKIDEALGGTGAEGQDQLEGEFALGLGTLLGAEQKGHRSIEIAIKGGAEVRREGSNRDHVERFPRRYRSPRKGRAVVVMGLRI